MVGGHTTLAALVREFGGLVFSLDARAPEDVRALVTDDARLLQAVPTDVCIQSGRVRGGELFAALPGLRVDGWNYIPDAFQRGAHVALAAVDRSLPSLRRRCLASGAPIGGRLVWVHPRAREVVGPVASAVHGQPMRRLDIAGVTGTNGKTSVCHLVGQVLRAAGRKPAVIGTAGHTLYSERGPLRIDATHTTPDATETQRIFARHVAGGGDAAVMEVSSHALTQDRIAGVEFRAAAFTNLTREHLDYHRSMERYLEAKATLWDHLVPGGDAVIFGSSSASLRMRGLAEERGARVVTADIEKDADLMARGVEHSLLGTSFEISGLGLEPRRIRLMLRGLHNVENALVAAALALSFGADPEGVLEALECAVAAPGRLEPVRGPGGTSEFEVFVDYAHSPDAIERVLGGLRADLSADGRLICVFGCGGDRDRGKRVPMGRAAGRLADVSIVTSDNPRSEDPAAIADAVLKGVDDEAGRRIVELDRRSAIARAVGMARPGDIVLIAGKGHENTQVIGGEALPFDDRVVAAELMAQSASSSGEASAGLSDGSSGGVTA